MSIATPTTDNPAAARDRLRADLARLRRRLRLQLALELLTEALAAAVTVGALLVALDWSLRPGLPARGAMLAVAVAAILALVLVRAAGRWRSARLDDLSLALTLDRLRPGLGQQVADVLQLPDQLEDPAGSASPAMIHLAVRRAGEALGSSGWTRLWNRRRTIAHAALAVLALAVPAAFAAIAPDAARLSFARWFRGSDERWPQSTYLTVMNLDARGRLIAPRDERALLEVRSDLPLIEPQGDRWSVGGRGSPLLLRRKPEDTQNPETVAVRERSPMAPPRSANMIETSPAHYQYEFPPASESSTFGLTGGDDWLGPITIERVDRPALASTRLRVKEPGTADPDFRDVDDSSARPMFLPDTEVELTLEGTQDLAAAAITANPGAASPLERLDPRSFRTRWTLKEAVTFEIVLTSAETGLASKPSFLTIGLQRDREPRVTLRATGVGGRVTPTATIPLSIAATDDFGLAALRIQFERGYVVAVADTDRTEQRTNKSAIPIPFESDPARPVLDHQARHDVALQASPPFVGTVLRFTGEADDRCAQGAQTGRSGVLAFSVVSPDDLFYEILIRQRAERAKFLAIVEAAEKSTPVLEGDASPEEVVAIARAGQSAARQVDQIAGRIADALVEMKLNQIGSPKSYRLLQEGVVDPLRALAAGPMPQLHSSLQAFAAAGGKGPAKDEARRRHAEVVTTMRRILEQMSQWESFVDVVNQVAEVIEMERKVLQRTEKARETRAQEVFDDKP